MTDFLFARKVLTQLQPSVLILLKSKRRKRIEPNGKNIAWIEHVAELQRSQYLLVLESLSNYLNG